MSRFNTNCDENLYYFHNNEQENGARLKGRDQFFKFRCFQIDAMNTV